MKYFFLGFVKCCVCGLLFFFWAPDNPTTRRPEFRGKKTRDKSNLNDEWLSWNLLSLHVPLFSHNHGGSVENELSPTVVTFHFKGSFPLNHDYGQKGYPFWRLKVLIVPKVWTFLGPPCPICLTKKTAQLNTAGVNQMGPHFLGESKPCKLMVLKKIEGKFPQKISCIVWVGS